MVGAFINEDPTGDEGAKWMEEPLGCVSFWLIDVVKHTKALNRSTSIRGRAASLRSGSAHDRAVEEHEPPRAVRFHTPRSTAHDSLVRLALLGVYVVR